MNDQLAERLCIALEQLALEMAERNSPAPAPFRAVAVPNVQQPAPAPQQPFAPFPQWQCPVHGSSRVVPAGVSKRTGKPYQAFLACNEYSCNEKPQDGRPPAPARAVAPSDSGQSARSVLP